MVKIKADLEQFQVQMDTALDQWEGEGGAQAWPWTPRYKGGAPSDRERQVLEYLGAAVVSGWNELPINIQRTIFQHATANKVSDTARLREKIARFLHDHKDDPRNR
ncbi:hypothetical protein [Geminicoccus flavidas]|uniref:hypothetical protein n=1 Tax=Geminicoccus flavidas TaxID=2506407 RepID=UPI0013596BA7|nr:hypothetical protein [Geminicoccus flavidas]